MTYKLELTKPDNIRGSIHGKIDAYINLYDIIGNMPVSEINADKVLHIISSKLRYLGCKNLEVLTKIYLFLLTAPLELGGTQAGFFNAYLYFFLWIYRGLEPSLHLKGFLVLCVDF